jgi:polyisoprenyl-phosphate glycosyltransferase
MPDGGFDFVLFDRQIKDRILAMSERNSNIFYLMVWMGYAYVNIPYVRQAREIGKSRWTIQKRIKLLIDSLLSFSFFPVRAITVSGMVLGAVAFLYAIYILAAKLFGAIGVPGWTALMVVVLFVSAFQMIALGIIGEYVWRTLDAARQRPLYVEDEVRSATSAAQPSSRP